MKTNYKLGELNINNSGNYYYNVTLGEYICCNN